MSVHVIEAKFLLLEVCTTTLSSSIWHMKSVHIISLRPRFYCESSTTTLSPSTWHHDVSTHDWGKVSTAGGLYYHVESQYLTHEVSSHSWGHVSTAKGQYNYIVSKYLTHEVITHHWDRGSSARCQYCYFESQCLTPWCQYRWQYTSLRSVLIPWGPVSDTFRSVHITEANVLLLDVSTTTLSPSIWHNDVSTHHWGQVSTPKGQYYYI